MVTGIGFEGLTDGYVVWTEGDEGMVVEGDGLGVGSGVDGPTVAGAV
jgi:hypothetical protein